MTRNSEQNNDAKQRAKQHAKQRATQRRTHTMKRKQRQQHYDARPKRLQLTSQVVNYFRLNYYKHLYGNMFRAPSSVITRVDHYKLLVIIISTKTTSTIL